MQQENREESLKNWLEHLPSGYGLQKETLRKASADASFRSYYRIDGQDGKTFIVMDAPPPEDTRPFIKVDQLMRFADLNVPVIYEKDEEQGFLLLSDLGSQTYLDVLNGENANRLMDDATDALVRWQKISCPGVLPEYDEAVLRRELELFPTWYVEKHLGLEISDGDRFTLNRMFDLIIHRNLNQAKVFVHRDFMPRNLMPEAVNNPGILDFQDALYGPISYDIASLCRDAFISWEEPIVIDWTIRYWEKARKAGLPVPSDFGRFWEDVEWMGLQRHLKVLGIFARINYRDGKPKYLADTPRFMNYVMATVHRYGELKPLEAYLENINGVVKKDGYTF